MNAPACVTLYCPLCQMDVQAEADTAVGTLLHCPACAEEFQFAVPKESLAPASTPISAPSAAAVTAAGVSAIACNVPEKWATSAAAVPVHSTPEKPKVAKFTKVAQRNAAKVHAFGYAGCALVILAPIALGLYFYPAIKAQFWPDSEESAANTADDSNSTAPADATNSSSGALTYATSKPAAGSDAAPRKLSAEDAAKQTNQRKVVEGKIRSATGFLHDGGRAAFDRALAEMNTAQTNYEGQRRNAPGRGKGNALDRAQAAIDIAFCHGLESYDYLIQKKIVQLNAASNMDTTGITQTESNKIHDQLDEARWLAQKGAVIWWIGRFSKPGTVKYWQNPTLSANKDGLSAHDRADEVMALQKAADENF